jgi:hypothetical protein
MIFTVFQQRPPIRSGDEYLPNIHPWFTVSARDAEEALHIAKSKFTFPFVALAVGCNPVSA